MREFKLSQCTDYLLKVRDVMPLYLREIVKDCSPKDLSLIYDGFLYHTSITPKQVRTGSFSILASSCFNIVKTISSFTKLYNYELKTAHFASSFARLLHEVSFEESQYSVKKRIEHYANYLFPDSELRLTGVRVLSGPLGQFLRNWARRVQKFGSKNERASISMSLLKVNNAINRGDYMSLSRHDIKYKASKEPNRSVIAEEQLKRQIKMVVSYLYKPRQYTDLSHIDAPFHNGSFETSKSEGGSHTTLIGERQEYLYMGYRPKLGVSETKVHPWWDDESELQDSYDAKICHIADKGKIRSITAISAHANHQIKKYQRYFFEPIWANKIYSYTQCDPQREPSHFEDLLDPLKAGFLNDKLPRYMSGDFNKCTDMFNKKWTKYVMERVCKETFGRNSDGSDNFDIDDLCPQWRQHYNNIANTTELNLPFFYGQPQGHGLSFAILCVINLAIISLCFDKLFEPEMRELYSIPTRESKKYGRIHANTLVPLWQLPVKINGDDIVFRSNQKLYEFWCQYCVDLGLEVNQVKSYFSDTHFTLNSRAFTFEDGKCKNCTSFLPAQICTPPRGSISIEKLQYYYKHTEESIADYSARCENFIRSSSTSEYINRLKIFLKLNPLRPNQKYNKKFLLKPPMPLFVSQDQGGLGLKIPTYLELNSKIIFVEKRETRPGKVFGMNEYVYIQVPGGLRVCPKDSFLQVNGEQRAHMHAFDLLKRNGHSDVCTEPEFDSVSFDRPSFGLGYHEEKVINLDHDILSCSTEVKELPIDKEKSIKRWLELSYMYRMSHHLVEEKDMYCSQKIAAAHKIRKQLRPYIWKGDLRCENKNVNRERIIYTPLDWLSPLDGTAAITTIDH